MMPVKISQNSPSPNDLAARTRELAARAEALASAITTLHHDIRAAHDESGFRYDTAIGCARGAAAKPNSGPQRLGSDRAHTHITSFEFRALLLAR